MECDAFIMAALLPGNLRQTFIVPNSDRSRSLAQAGKEARKEGGGGQVNRKGSRGRSEGSNETMVFIFSLRQSEQPLSGKSFGVGALFIIVAGRHKRRECGKRRKTRVR